MNKTLQHDYAKIVLDFTQKMPSDLNITTQEIDAYFQDCVLYLISFDEQMRITPDLEIVNQLYTEVPVGLSSEQLASKFELFQSNRNTGVAVPDFFLRMLKADAVSGTRNCHEFICVQRETLMLYVSFKVTFSFEENRRITYLCDRLMVICDHEGVSAATTLEGVEPNISQETIKKLNSSLKESADSIFRKRRDSTSKYAQHRKREQEQAEVRTSAILAEAKKFEDEFDQMIEAEQSTKALKRKRGGAASDLSDIVYSRLNKSSLPTGRLPSWTRGKGVFSDTEIESQYDQNKILALEESLAKLDRLIGLNSVKDQVNRLVLDIHMNSFRTKYDLPTPPAARHLVFSGNPGTGKTTVARILAQIYGALGLVSIGHLIEVDRSGLVAEYLGQTEKKTMDVIESALGGVLFIDEAYSLAEDEDDQYGRAAISTLLKAMEDHYDDFVVIVAGYDEKMSHFIDSNPGLKSRFATKIRFDDYSGAELYEIFARIVQDGGDCLDEQAIAAAKIYFDNMYETRDENFGNGRDARNCYDKIRPLRSARLARICMARENKEPTKEELRTFTVADFTALILLDDEEKKAKEKIVAEKKKKSPKGGETQMT